MVNSYLRSCQVESAFLFYFILLLTVPLAIVIGESPSSSASDIDNLNNHGLAKVASVKDSNSPQVVGANHLMVARNHPHMMRLLAYVCFFCAAVTTI